MKLARPFGAPAALVKCYTIVIPGASVPEIADNLSVLSTHRFFKVVINAGAIEIRLCQSEVTEV